jgi:hypothetical protein
MDAPLRAMGTARLEADAVGRLVTIAGRSIDFSLTLEDDSGSASVSPGEAD